MNDTSVMEIMEILGVLIFWACCVYLVVSFFRGRDGYW